jgi:hypothetical protein
MRFNGSRTITRMVRAFARMVGATASVLLPLAAIVLGACVVGPLVLLALLALPFGIVGAAVVTRRHPVAPVRDCRTDAAHRAHLARRAAIRAGR